MRAGLILSNHIPGRSARGRYTARQITLIHLPSNAQAKKININLNPGLVSFHALLSIMDIGSNLENVRVVDHVVTMSTRTGIGNVYNQGVRLKKLKERPRTS